MKRYRVFALAAVLVLASPAMVACNTVPEVASLQGTTVDEKAVVAAQRAYNVAGNAYLVAVRRGLLTGAAKDQAKAALMDAFTALSLATEAQQTADRVTTALRLSQFHAALATAKRLTP